MRIVAYPLMGFRGIKVGNKEFSRTDDLSLQAVYLLFNVEKYKKQRISYQQSRLASRPADVGLDPKVFYLTARPTANVVPGTLGRRIGIQTNGIPKFSGYHRQHVRYSGGCTGSFQRAEHALSWCSETRQQWCSGVPSRAHEHVELNPDSPILLSHSNVACVLKAERKSAVHTTCAGFVGFSRAYGSRKHGCLAPGRSAVVGFARMVRVDMSGEKRLQRWTFAVLGGLQQTGCMQTLLFRDLFYWFANRNNREGKGMYSLSEPRCFLVQCCSPPAPSTLLLCCFCSPHLPSTKTKPTTCRPRNHKEHGTFGPVQQ